MFKTKDLRIRLRKEQFDLIKTRAQLNGFKTISAYARDKLLRVPYHTEKMLVEIYEKLFKIKS